jgi:hypothetical protein
MLEPMAREYAPEGFAFLFVYTREAHPGENYGPHRSMEQKLAHARAFKERGRVERPILVDDLVGTGHTHYGALPNMTYVIGRGGRVLFRSDWTDPPTLTFFLKYLLDVRARRRSGERLAGFYAEWIGYRNVDPAKFQQGLEVAGPQAVEDFARTMQRWTSQGKIPSRMEG